MSKKPFFPAVQPNRKLGQYILVSQSALAAELSLAELSEHDTVLEIGAGPGNLTGLIAQRCHVIAVEKDRRFLPQLEKLPRTTVIHGDALEVLAHAPAFNKIISNIPYALSQPLLLMLLKMQWERAVLIVQKEFAEKLITPTKLGMLLSGCASVAVAAHVSRQDFYPAAPYDSSIVVIDQQQPMDERFWKFLSPIYRERNRDVRNVLKDFPQELARKKVHQLTYEEIKALYEMNNSNLL
ncbi:MAG: hypothetical protein HYY37_06925 [Candidatus Aenigmarchaeota archaeon]|nr:hypothetical protein [Candidatus Aenigmarchaeota archaeon]